MFIRFFRPRDLASRDGKSTGRGARRMAKARVAGLTQEERSSYFAEFCRGLKQSSYLSV